MLGVDYARRGKCLADGSVRCPVTLCREKRAVGMVMCGYDYGGVVHYGTVNEGLRLYSARLKFKIV